MAALVKPLLNDTVAGIIFGPNNEPINRPATSLSMDEARLIRAVDRMSAVRRMHVEILCSSCWDNNPAKKMAAEVTPTEIHLICEHRQLFYIGETPLATRTDMRLDDSISYEEARILRGFDKALSMHGLLAAYYCHDCDQNGVHNGMRVALTDSSIDMQCRHRILRHRGQSY